jgi:hypothetical protein
MTDIVNQYCVSGTSFFVPYAAVAHLQNGDILEEARVVARDTRGRIVDRALCKVVSE